MSVYVGIDVHRKRSQVAVVAEDGQAQLNRNVVNGQEPMLRLIGGLPSGTPVAFEAAYGWGWLVELLEDYGFEPHLVHPLRCKAIASARLKNDKAGRGDPDRFRTDGTWPTLSTVDRPLLRGQGHGCGRCGADHPGVTAACGPGRVTLGPRRAPAEARISRSVRRTRLITQHVARAR